MSGILALLGRGSSRQLASGLEKLRHRGDEPRTVLTAGNLAVGLVATDGDGSFTDGVSAAVLDGRIFNLVTRTKAARIKGRNSAELLLRLYRSQGRAGLQELDGEFSFVISDGRDLILGRDRLGIKPLYHAGDAQDGVIASEFKAIPSRLPAVEFVPPGSGVVFGTGRGFNLSHQTRPEPLRTDARVLIPRLRELLRAAVSRRLAPGGRTGVFLSGGIDSAVIAYLAAGITRNLVFFTAGMKDSRDVEMATELARFLKVELHRKVYGLDEIRKVIPEVVYHLESYDAPLVRSAIPNYLVARLAHRHGVRRVLIGEGGDELFAGYDNLKALSGRQLHVRLWQMLNSLHNGGLQRCDRIPQSQGIEASIPFLDTNLFRFAFAISPDLKLRHGIEKWILRKAFEGRMPGEIVWRPKQKFSAGAGSQLALETLMQRRYPARVLAAARRRFPGAAVRSGEELHYFRQFHRFFPNSGLYQLLGRTELN